MTIPLTNNRSFFLKIIRYRILAMISVATLIIAAGCWYYCQPPRYPGVYRFQCGSQNMTATHSNPRKLGKTEYHFDHDGVTGISGVRSSPSDIERQYYRLIVIPLIELSDGKITSPALTTWEPAGRAYTLLESMVPDRPRIDLVTESWIHSDEFREYDIAKDRDIISYIFLVSNKDDAIDLIEQQDWYVYEFSIKELDNIKKHGLMIPDILELTQVSKHSRGNEYWQAYTLAKEEDRKYSNLHNWDMNRK